MQREYGGGVGSPNKTSGGRILGVVARNEAEIPTPRSWGWCVLGQACDWTAEFTSNEESKSTRAGKGEKPSLRPPQCTLTQT